MPDEKKPPKIDLGFLRPYKPSVPFRIERNPKYPRVTVVVPVTNDPDRWKKPRHPKT